MGGGGGRPQSMMHRKKTVTEGGGRGVKTRTSDDAELVRKHAHTFRFIFHEFRHCPAKPPPAVPLPTRLRPRSMRADAWGLEPHGCLAELLFAPRTDSVLASPLNPVRRHRPRHASALKIVNRLPGAAASAPSPLRLARGGRLGESC